MRELTVQVVGEMVPFVGYLVGIQKFILKKKYYHSIRQPLGENGTSIKEGNL